MNVEYLRFFVYQIYFLRSFLRRPHTDRFPDDVLKKLRRNRNRDSCEKNATGAEKTGILRIPAGIGNLGSQPNIEVYQFFMCPGLGTTYRIRNYWVHLFLAGLF